MWMHQIYPTKLLPHYPAQSFTIFDLKSIFCTGAKKDPVGEKLNTRREQSF